MKSTPTLLKVYGEADGQRYWLGSVGYDARRGQGSFEWSPEALAAGLEWSPLHLPLTPGLWVSSPKEHDLLGLPGLIHDALPDGWGLLLMDRAFRQRGISPAAVTPLLRLAFLADRCWGALSFAPEWGTDLTKRERASMTALAQEAQLVQEGDTAQVSQQLLTAGGSPHGARPKIMVAINADDSHALVGHEALPEGYRHVLIKFAATNEPSTYPLLEYLYTEGARQLGIDTMPARMIQAGERLGVCFDRFDRQQGQRQHVHSLAGLLHTTHRIANTDWTQVSQVLQQLPGGFASLEQGYRRAVFNAVWSVRDDHTKNIALQRNAQGTWSLAPAYDLCYSPGPGGWHTMTYAHHAGQHVLRSDLLRLAEAFQIDAQDAMDLIEHSQHVREDTLLLARQEGVERGTLTALRQQFRDIDRALKPPRPPRAQARP